MNRKFVKYKSKRFISLRTRILTAFLFIILFICCISITFVCIFINHYTLISLQKKLSSNSEYISKIQTEEKLFDVDNMDLLYDKIAENGFSVVFFDKSMNYVTGRNIDAIKSRMHSDFENKISDYIRPYIQQNGTKMMFISGVSYPSYTQSITDADNQLIGYIVILAPLNEMENIKTSLIFYCCTVIAACIGAFIISAVLSESLTSNIHRLKARVEDIGNRDFDKNMPVFSNDEVGELANTFENMANNIKEYDLNQKVFIQNASHELRTPLMCVRGYIEGIKDGVFTDNESIYDTVLKQVDRMEKVVNDIIYLSKIETSNIEIKKDRFNISDIIFNAIDNVKGICLANNIDIICKNISDVDVYVDYESVLTAISNILSNSVRYAKTKIEIYVEICDRNVDIKIIDDGCGIESCDMPHLFERFYKGKSGKSGLGLAIAKAIINLHEGDIKASNLISESSSEDNQIISGAVFEIFIPI